MKGGKVKEREGEGREGGIYSTPPTSIFMTLLY